MSTTRLREQIVTMGCRTRQQTPSIYLESQLEPWKIGTRWYKMVQSYLCACVCCSYMGSCPVFATKDGRHPCRVRPHASPELRSPLQRKYHTDPPSSLVKEKQLTHRTEHTHSHSHTVTSHDSHIHGEDENLLRCLTPNGAVRTVLRTWVALFG